MKNFILSFISLFSCVNVFAQYSGVTIGAGYTLSPSTFSPAIFNASYNSFVNPDQASETITMDKESYLGGAVPIHIDYFSKHFNFDFQVNIPLGMTSKGKEFKKVYDTQIIKLGLAGGGWIKKTVGIFGGVHYGYDMYRVKEFVTIRPEFAGAAPLTAPIRGEANPQNYYINKMNLNEPGIDVHLLFGSERFLVKASFYYDFVSVTKKSMNLGDQKLKGHNLTPELSVFVPFDRDKSFGMFLKAAYKMRTINGSNSFAMNNAGEVPGYFPKFKTNQFLFTVGLMLPPGIFGSVRQTTTTVKVL